MSKLTNFQPIIFNDNRSLPYGIMARDEGGKRVIVCAGVFNPATPGGIESTLAELKRAKTVFYYDDDMQKRGKTELMIETSMRIDGDGECRMMKRGEATVTTLKNILAHFEESCQRREEEPTEIIFENLA